MTIATKPSLREPTPAMGGIEAFAGDGLVLRGTRAGPADGPPVLLLHGGGQTRHSWKRTQEILADAGYLAIALDLRGHGESDWAPSDQYRLTEFAADTRALLAGYHRPAAVVGASLGGISTLLAAGEPPFAPLGALMLIDIVPRIEEQGVEPIKAFMRARPDGFATPDEAADLVASYLPHRPRPTDTSGLMKNLRRRPDGRLRWHWDPAYIDVAGMEQTPDERADRLEVAARRIEAPTLLVRGTRSEVVTEEAMEAFRKVMPDARIVDVANATHMVAADRNDVFSDAILAFMGGVYPARPRS